MRLSKALIFALGVVVGGAIGSVATYIFFGRKAEGTVGENEVGVYLISENPYFTDYLFHSFCVFCIY